MVSCGTSGSEWERNWEKVTSLGCLVYGIFRGRSIRLVLPFPWSFTDFTCWFWAPSNTTGWALSLLHWSRFYRNEMGRIAVENEQNMRMRRSPGADVLQLNTKVKIWLLQPAVDPGVTSALWPYLWEGINLISSVLKTGLAKAQAKYCRGHLPQPCQVQQSLPLPLKIHFPACSHHLEMPNYKFVSLFITCFQVIFLSFLFFPPPVFFCLCLF